MSGVSTAAEVTDISGRGVGMDAVRRDIEGAGGRITVFTKKGEGSTFTITLPRTVSTQILEAFVIGVHESCYVLPLDRIAESYVIQAADLVTLPGGVRVLHRHDAVVPLIDLYDVFSLKRDGPIDFRASIIVTVEAEESIFAVLVDDIIGTQQVVVKDLEVGRIDPNVFVGCAVMGDGQIAMVLNVDELAKLCAQRNHGPSSALVQPAGGEANGNEAASEDPTAAAPPGTA